MNVKVTTANELSEIVSLMKDPEKGLGIKDRKYMLKKYKQCFVGEEAVSWMVNHHFAITRDEAIHIGNYLMSLGIFYHVAREHSFEDKYFFYRFSEDDDLVVSPFRKDQKEVTSEEQLSVPNQRRKTIIIIGGGFAGSKATQALENDFDVIMIDFKEYHESTPAMPNLLVEPQQMGNVQVLHKKHIKRGKFIHGKVVDITESPDQVILHDGTKLSFDYLLICSGSSYTPPIKVSTSDNRKAYLDKILAKLESFDELFDETDEPVKPRRSSFAKGADSELETLASRKQTILLCAKEIEQARTVMVVGGGPVGVEVAAEILHHYPKKSVTIVTDAPQLLMRLPESARKTAEERLKKLGATILYHERVDTTAEFQEGKLNFYKTKTGQTIEADIVLKMIGIVPNSSFMKNHFGKHLNERGQIHVNPSLQLIGYPNIFALGDVTDVEEEKMAMMATAHAKLTVKNIYRMENGQLLLPYKSPSPMMLVSLGPSDGISVIGDRMMPAPGFVLGKMKGTLIKYDVHLVAGCYEDHPNKKCFTCMTAAKFAP